MSVQPGHFWRFFRWQWCAAAFRFRVYRVTDGNREPELRRAMFQEIRRKMRHDTEPAQTLQPPHKNPGKPFISA